MKRLTGTPFRKPRKELANLCASIVGFAPFRKRRRAAGQRVRPSSRPARHAILSTDLRLRACCTADRLRASE